MWVRDLLLSRVIDGYRQAFEPDDPCAVCGGEVSPDSLLTLYDRVEESIGRLRGNANKQLVMESICLNIKDVLYGKGCWNPLP